MEGIEYIVIGACALVFIAALCKRNTASHSKLEQMYNEYSSFVDEYNDVVSSTYDICSQMDKRRFGSELEETKAQLLISSQMSTFNLIRSLCEAMAENMKEKNVKIHKRLSEDINGNLARAAGNFSSLSHILSTMLTKEEFEMRKEKEKRREAEQATKTNMLDGSIFFDGCNNGEMTERRYKALAKVYHPDMPTGNEEIFKLIRTEYERRMRF